MLDAEIRLFVPRQVKDEITRNREAKLKDWLINFEVKPIKYPAFCKEYDEYEDFCRDYSDLVKRYKTWEKKIKTDIFEETLPADTVIKELIEKAGIKVENKDYTADELKKCVREITEYIMSQSSKNGDISKLSNEYRSIFRIFDTK